MNTRNRSGKVDSEQYNAKWNQRVKIIPSKVPKEIIKENRTKIENTKERLFKLASKLITNEIRMINRDINARKQPILITGPDESNLKRYVPIGLVLLLSGSRENFIPLIIP